MITAGQLRLFRRHAWLAITVLGALVTPPNPLSLLVFMAVGIVPYETAIVALDWIGRH